MIRRVIIRLFKADLMQVRWGRKLIGGKFYKLWPEGLQMGAFWSDTLITNCQTIILKEEFHEKAQKQTY